MSDQHGKKTDETAFSDRVGARAERKLKAQRTRHGIWFGFAMTGLIGWSIVLPTLLGAALGMWLDGNHPGKYSWTLALLVAGLTLGCWNAWRWVSKEEQEMLDEPEKKND